VSTDTHTPRHARAVEFNAPTLEVEVEWSQVVRYSSTVRVTTAQVAEYLGVDTSADPGWVPSQGELLDYMRYGDSEMEYTMGEQVENDRDGEEDATVRAVTFLSRDDLENADEPEFRHSTCHNCLLDVEGVEGGSEWMDRGGNLLCPNGLDRHLV
jgi:hypothetical protein